MSRPPPALPNFPAARQSARDSAGRRTGRPLYVFVKPPPALKAHIASLAETDSRRPADHLHITIQPLGDRTAYSPRDFAALVEAFEALAAPPFHVVFDHVVGHGGHMTLRPGEPVHGALAFRKRLVATFARAGVVVPAYRFRPHITLDYNRGAAGTRPIDPISWRVEEVLLVESVHGRTRHIEHARRPLRGAADRGNRAA